MTKGQLIHAVVLRVVHRSVIEEAAEHAALAAVRINHQHQTLEPARAVDALGANVLSMVCQPDIEVASSSIGTARTKVDVDDEVWVLQGLLAPNRTARIAWRNGGEDDLAGEDLGFVWLAGDDEVGDDAGIVCGAYSKDRDTLAAISCAIESYLRKHTALHIQNSSR